MNQTGLFVVQNESYPQYEKILLEREELLFSCREYMMKYLRVFGNQMIKTFQKKADCTRKKQLADLCNTAARKGGALNMNMLDEELKKGSEELLEQVQQLEGDVYLAKNFPPLYTKEEYDRCFAVYTDIYRNVSPDINPETEEDYRLKFLYQSSQECFYSLLEGDLVQLREEVYATLRDYELAGQRIIIPEIRQKMERVEEDIRTIRKTTPYIYKDVLSDPNAILRRMDELIRECQEYTELEKSLDRVLKNMMKDGLIKFAYEEGEDGEEEE